ncbi:uncharacterized protein LTR77_007567 [Saxophila tyrrhenica]|uniref:Uncharacterized protein n=1 Tax=Saxophila tyrrhenica TaxID=1690608 RepID=A0AAV9P6G6_9PEZI|nr:hypothetical protein LTR77_007567 [Saxophila tyrrhenica]
MLPTLVAAYGGTTRTSPPVLAPQDSEEEVDEAKLPRLEEEERKAKKFTRQLRKVSKKRRGFREWLDELYEYYEYATSEMATKEEQQAKLKTHLAITPKTVGFLYDAGYTTPASLREATPNEVVAKLAELPGLDFKKAKAYYLRPLRRMVMLGDIEDLDEARTVAAKLQKWSIVELVRLGVWVEGFDDLNGVQIHEKMKGCGAI